MKKTIALLLALLLVVGTSMALALPASAALATEVSYTTADGQELTLDATVKTADEGKVSFENGVLTLNNASGNQIKWSSGDLTIVVKGNVTIDRGESANHAIFKADATQPGNLTVRLEDGAVLTAKAKEYGMVTYNGDITFEGDGEVNAASYMQRGLGVGGADSTQLDFTVTVKDSVRLNITGEKQENILFAQAKSFHLNIQDSAKVTVNSMSGKYAFRVVSTPTTVTLSGTSSLTLMQGVDGAISDTPIVLAVGQHTALTFKQGSDKVAANEVPTLTVDALNVSRYVEIAASYTEEENWTPTDTTDDTDATDETDTSSTDSEKPTDTDTSSSSTKDTSSDKSSDTASSNTASSDAASESGSLTWLWIVIAAVVVVAVVVVVVLSRRKKS